MTSFRTKNLLIVDLFSVHLLSRVDIVNRYIAVDFTFALLDYARHIKEFVISRFVISRFVISRTSLNRGSLNRRFSVAGTLDAETPVNGKPQFLLVIGGDNKVSFLE